MPDLTAFESRLRRVDSRQNAHVRDLRRGFAEAAPNDRGEVAVEGMHLIEEAVRSGLKLSTVFFSESARERAHRLVPQLSSHTEVLLLPDSVFASAVPTETPQGVAALVRVKAEEVATILKTLPVLLMITAGLQDPGNLGTIARSAEAFGVTGLLLGERSVSPWNWKALRASAGSLFRLPHAKVELATALGAVKSRGIRVLATSSHKGRLISEVDLRVPIAFVIGNEGAGIPKEILAEADEIVAIPQTPKVESLNAGIASSILLYEAARQRSANSPQSPRDTEA
jgi:RNA methyltransferase, TrmH family